MVNTSNARFEAEWKQPFTRENAIRSDNISFVSVYESIEEVGQQGKVSCLTRAIFCHNQMKENICFSILLRKVGFLQCLLPTSFVL